jgi:hypothetical protein
MSDYDSGYDDGYGAALSSCSTEIEKLEQERDALINGLKGELAEARKALEAIRHEAEVQQVWNGQGFAFRLNVFGM